MRRKRNRNTRTRALILESLDPRLCLAAGMGSVGMGEMRVDHAGAHVSHWHNSLRPHDVNQDQNVTPADALVVVNTLNTRGARMLSAAEGETAAQVDVNGDSQVTPADCLAVVNELNQESVVDATADEATSDDASLDEVLVDDGTVDDGTVDDGTVDDGTADDGTVDDGTVDDGTVDDGTVDDLPPGHHGHCDPPRPSPADLFAGADANEDGMLTEDELPPHVWERLSAADADGDGSLTLEELNAFTPDGGPHGPRPGGNYDGNVFDRLDQNDDGLLDQDEVPEELWERISPADTDEDGMISSDELAAFRPSPPPREGTAPNGPANASREGALPERGPAPHRGGGPGAVTSFGGNSRRA